MIFFINLSDSKQFFSLEAGRLRIFIREQRYNESDLNNSSDLNLLANWILNKK